MKAFWYTACDRAYDRTFNVLTFDGIKIEIACIFLRIGPTGGTTGDTPSDRRRA